MTLWRRVLSEKRSIVVPLALVLLANIAAYGLVVYPLGVKSAGAADRAAAAAAARQASDRDYAAARALVAGKSQAEQEIATFYGHVLPADFSSARDLTYATIPALARKTDVSFVTRRVEQAPLEKGSRLGLMKIHMAFQGQYENLRRFIYELESAPEFVIIDDVTLTQSDPAKPLMLTLEMSTYYRLGADGD